MEALYNTKEGITQYLRNGLQGLHDLMEDRKQAFDRREPQAQFVLLGRWWLMNSCWPQLSLFMRDYIPNEVLGSIPQVMTWQEFMSFFELYEKPGQDNFLAGANLEETGLPPVNAACYYCGQGWTLENSFDSRTLPDFGDDRRCLYFHIQCRKKFDQQEREKSFTGLLRQAGVNITELTSPQEVSVKVKTDKGFLELLELQMFDCCGSYLIASDPLKPINLLEQVMTACEAALLMGRETELLKIVSNPLLIKAEYSQLPKVLAEAYQSLA